MVEGVVGANVDCTEEGFCTVSGGIEFKTLLEDKNRVESSGSGGLVTLSIGFGIEELSCNSKLSSNMSIISNIPGDSDLADEVSDSGKADVHCVDSNNKSSLSFSQSDCSESDGGSNAMICWVRNEVFFAIVT